MQYFDSAQEFLSLFEIDTNKDAAQDFIMLAEYMAVMRHYYQYGVTVSRIAQELMRERKLSPKVFWGRMKRTLRPIFGAEPATLQALGLAVGGALTLTCPYLAECVAEVMEPSITEEHAQLAADIARACGHAK